MKVIELPEDEFDMKIIEKHEDKISYLFNDADSFIETPASN